MRKVKTTRKSTQTQEKSDPYDVYSYTNEEDFYDHYDDFLTMRKLRHTGGTISEGGETQNIIFAAVAWIAALFVGVITVLLPAKCGQTGNESSEESRRSGTTTQRTTRRR